MNSKPSKETVAELKSRLNSAESEVSQLQVKLSQVESKLNDAINNQDKGIKSLVELGMDFQKQSEFAERLAKAATTKEDSLAAGCSSVVWRRASNLLRNALNRCTAQVA